MNIHEYQAKQLLSRYGVAVPRGKVAYTAAEAVDAANELGGPVWVVKAQIHVGGRGKGGGVRVVRSIDDVRDAAQAMIGMTSSPTRPGRKGAGSSGSISRKGAISRASSISGCWSTAKPTGRP